MARLCTASVSISVLLVPLRRLLVGNSHLMLQVLEDAKAIDDAYEAGQDIRPLCGLAFAVKDNIDVLG